MRVPTVGDVIQEFNDERRRALLRAMSVFRDPSFEPRDLHRIGNQGSYLASKIAGQGFDYFRMDDFTPLDGRDPRNGIGLLALVAA